MTNIEINTSASRLFTKEGGDETPRALQPPTPTSDLGSARPSYRRNEQRFRDDPLRILNQTKQTTQARTANNSRTKQKDQANSAATSS